MVLGTNGNYAPSPCVLSQLTLPYLIICIHAGGGGGGAASEGGGGGALVGGCGSLGGWPGG